MFNQPRKGFRHNLARHTRWSVLQVNKKKFPQNLIKSHLE